MNTFMTLGTHFFLLLVNCYLLSPSSYPLSPPFSLSCASRLLGFPFETTLSISRLIVTGTFDRFPKLKILVAHAGAALPSLIGRLDSCVHHDVSIATRLQHAPSHYFRQLYFDAISYNPIALQALVDMVGADRIMFGTDNPFFPPPGQPLDAAGVSSTPWPSTVKVYDGIQALTSKRTQQKILIQNARNLFDLPVLSK
jgi:aminocarboxymuconate-semialdehyde decarboxylase